VTNNVVPIWTPADAVDTARVFALELDNAERGTAVERDPWWLSTSRERTGRLYDGLAVALLLTLGALLGFIVAVAVIR
jgi:uncharacterized membrane protein